MGLINLFKNKKEDIKAGVKAPARGLAVPKINSEKKLVTKPTENAVETPAVKSEIKPSASKGALKGGSQQAYRTLVRPVVTEKATYLGSENKYLFVVDKTLNKIEVKKAIRTVYNVEPTQVNILNVSGKKVRYGRNYGRTKNWKKAIVTLKPGDKIEIYEGV